MGKVPLKDIHQQPVEADRLVFLWHGGISLLTENAVLSCDSIQGGLLAEEEFVRVDAEALNNEILIILSKT